MEASTYSTERVVTEPRWLLCLNCLRGGGKCRCINQYELDKLWERIQANPELHMTLTGAFDEVGARTRRFETQTPAERKKDLDVLQRLGLCYTDTRTARDLFSRVEERIPDLEGICRYPDNPYGKWEECELADGAYYAKGKGPLPWAQLPTAMAAQKVKSCDELIRADHVVIRAHHLLCIICHLGRYPEGQPLAEDNLCEALMKFRENPDIPVTLVEGPEACCICPPCHAFVPDRGVCVALCHLRDRKKDLDTFVVLGINPGDTLSARELYRRIEEKIPHVRIICGFAQDNSPEWMSCGGASSGQYEQGLARGVLLAPKP